MSTRILLSTLGTEMDCHTCLPAISTRGGILLAWKSQVLQMITTRIDEFSISALFHGTGGEQWWFTGVYGPQVQELRHLRMA